MTPADLLDQAERLIAAPPKRPRQVDLRRAVSAAYYALFHQLTGDAAGLYAGEAGNHARLRRTFDHSDLLRAAAEFKKGSSPRVLQLTPGPGLRSVAEAFAELYYSRNRADYDLSTSFSKQEALLAIDRCRTALTDWQDVAARDEGRLFLGSFTQWKVWDRTRP